MATPRKALSTPPKTGDQALDGYRDEIFRRVGAAAGRQVTIQTSTIADANARTAVEALADALDALGILNVTKT